MLTSKLTIRKSIEQFEEREVKARIEIFDAAKRWITDCTIYLDWENTVSYQDLVNLMSMISAKHLLTGQYVFVDFLKVNNFLESMSYPLVDLYNDHINELEIFIECCMSILVEEIRRLQFRKEIDDIYDEYLEENLIELYAKDYEESLDEDDEVGEYQLPVKGERDWIKEY